jgi:hypothetical protein
LLDASGGPQDIFVVFGFGDAACSFNGRHFGRLFHVYILSGLAIQVLIHLEKPNG